MRPLAVVEELVPDGVEDCLGLVVDGGDWRSIRPDDVEAAGGLLHPNINHRQEVQGYKARQPGDSGDTFHMGHSFITGIEGELRNQPSFVTNHVAARRLVTARARSEMADVTPTGQYTNKAYTAWR